MMLYSLCQNLSKLFWTPMFCRVTMSISHCQCCSPTSVLPWEPAELTSARWRHWNIMGMVWTYGGTPRAGYFIGEHAIKIDDLGLPLFQESPISINPGNWILEHWTVPRMVDFFEQLGNWATPKRLHHQSYQWTCLFGCFPKWGSPVHHSFIDGFSRTLQRLGIRHLPSWVIS